MGLAIQSQHNLLVRCRYIDFGDAQVSYRLSGEVIADEHRALADEVPVLGEGIALGGDYTAFRRDRFSVGANLGGMFWFGETESASGGSTLSGSESDISFFYGAFTEFRASSKWRLKLSYEKFGMASRLDIESVSLGLRYQLGEE